MKDCTLFARPVGALKILFGSPVWADTERSVGGVDA
jgi:hypothetical protein